ncbi:MAG: hypothetical protein ACOH1T_11285 [Microbacteriaceae bacterium]
MTTPMSIPVSPAAVIAPPRTLSIASFVLGMISIAFGFIFVVPAIGAVLGFIGLRNEPAARGFAIAGLWINLVIIGFWILAAGTAVLAVVGGVLSIPFWMQ